MKVSVIIPTRSHVPPLLLGSLSIQTYRASEIIEVVGSALTVQRNEGIKQATGDIILFIDDDIVLDSNYIKNVIENFQAFPRAVAVTGNVITSAYKQNILYSVFARIFMLTYRSDGKFQVSGFPKNYHQKIDKRIRGEMLYGCNMALKREVFKKFRFCEDLDCRMFGEDDYFAWLLSRNNVVYYNPFAICYDNRPYPQGKQALKIRHTIFNLIKRNKSRHPSLIENAAFWWAFSGFIIFKITEAIIMRDTSILQGMIRCFMKYADLPIAEVRDNLIIRRLNV